MKYKFVLLLAVTMVLSGCGLGAFSMQVHAPVTFGAKKAANAPKAAVKVTASSVVLSWNAVAPVPGGLPVAGYNAFRSIVTGGPYTQLNPALITTTSYTDIAVTPGTTYYYVVNTVDTGANTSVYSNQVSATIPVAPSFTISTQGPSSLTFTGVIGAPAPPSQTTAIIASPATALPITVASNAAWLIVSSSSATTKTTLTISVNSNGLAIGTYKANVVVTNTNGTAINSPFTIPVTFTLSAPLPAAPAVTVKSVQ